MDEIAKPAESSVEPTEASGSRSTPERRIDEAGRTLIKWGALWLTEETYAARKEKLIAWNKARPTAAAQDVDKASSYRDTLAWVLEHIWEANCPKGATALARSLWEAAKDRKAEFVSENMPLLVRGEKVQEQAEDEGGEVNRKLVEGLIAEFRGVCPKCGRGPDDDAVGEVP